MSNNTFTLLIIQQCESVPGSDLLASVKVAVYQFFKAQKLKNDQI